MDSPFPKRSPFYSQFAMPPDTQVLPARDDEASGVIDKDIIGIERHVLEDWMSELRDVAERQPKTAGFRQGGMISTIADEIDGYLDR